MRHSRCGVITVDGRGCLHPRNCPVHGPARDQPSATDDVTGAVATSEPLTTPELWTVHDPDADRVWGQPIRGVSVPEPVNGFVNARGIYLEHVDVGSAWDRTHIDLSGAALRDCAITDLDVPDDGTNVDGVVVNDASFDGRGLTVDQSTISGSRLPSAILSGVRVRLTVIERSDLPDVDLADATLADTAVGSSTLTGACMHRAALERVTFDGNVAHRVRGHGLTVVDSELASDLTGSVFDGATFERTTIDLHDSGPVTVRSSDLKDTTVSYAASSELSDSTLRRTLLSGGNDRVNLERSTFVQSRLAGSFRGANLNGVVFVDTTIDAAADFAGADTRNVRFLTRGPDSDLRDDPAAAAAFEAAHSRQRRPPPAPPAPSVE